MRLKRYRLQPEAFRIDIHILIRDKEIIILFSRTETSQSREDNHLMLVQHLTHLRNEIFYHTVSDIPVHTIGCRIHFRKKAIIIGVLPEIKFSVWRIDRIPPVGKRRRNYLRHKCSETGQSYLIIVKDQLLQHF